MKHPRQSNGSYPPPPLTAIQSSMASGNGKPDMVENTVWFLNEEGHNKWNIREDRRHILFGLAVAWIKHTRFTIAGKSAC